MDWLTELGKALLPGSGYPLLFNTLLFAVLFTALLMLLALLAGHKRTGAGVRVALLLAFSILFFIKASGWLVLLMLGTAALDWLLAQHMARQPDGFRRDVWLYLSLLINLGALGYYKYADFFGGVLMGADWQPLDLVLPLGISFYTFRSLSYVLDVHREMTDPEPSLPRYWLYTGFFLHLPAGPITRSEVFLAELRQPFQPTAQSTGMGLYRFAVGLVKKVVIADYLAANLVDRVFDSPGAFSGLENLMAVVGYAAQLYYDFSGYTDMAIGLALLVGLTLPENFRQPFRATSVTDFWRRWHLTLSSWFNDYVFTPLSLGWRKAGKVGIVAAVILTFTLSGLWHGAAWTFVIWGLAHGAAIGFETATVQARRAIQARLGLAWTALGWTATFLFLLATYVLFRAPDLATAGTIYNRIGTNLDWSLLPQWLLLYAKPAAMLALAFLLHFLPQRWKAASATRYATMPWVLQAVAFVLLVSVAYQARTSDMQPFVYLQF